MKRSQINELLNWSKALLHENKFYLPMFGYWTMDEWNKHKSELGRIRDTMLGWDITDFGSGDFNKIGAVLFTIRNGNVNKDNCGTPYAEKVILMQKGQMLPLHFHYAKTEDIINRGGGILLLKFYASKPDGNVDIESDVILYCDGIKRVFKAGESYEVHPGCSVTLTPNIYHLFLAEGDLVIGEVSKINDDNIDNHFAEEASRFSEIEEDEPILHPLCNEYDRVL